MPISISYQGRDHSTESVEAVQGFAAAKQEEEEREEEVEIVEKRREKKKIGGKGRNNCFRNQERCFVRSLHKIQFCNRWKPFEFFLFSDKIQLTGYQWSQDPRKTFSAVTEDDSLVV